MLETALYLVLGGVAALALVAVRRHWRATDRAIARAEADAARLTRAELHRRLRDAGL